jgi:hypothetical protein
MADSWTAILVDQLDFYMTAHLRPRLVGLSDEEYFWEPVPGSWSIRRHTDGHWFSESTWGAPEPVSPPFTTIAWRLVHIASFNLGTRVNTFFGDGSVPDSVDMFDPRQVPAIPGNAAEAVAQLEAMFNRWRDGIASLGDERLAAPVGPKGGPYADAPMAALVLHVSRETMHHGGEIGVLRDLYRVRS